MNYKKYVLRNGLRVIVVPLSNSPSATVTVWIKVGSRYETDKIAGISHFLEHMVFKGSKKHPTAKSISEMIDAMGAEFNAGTTKEWTNFYIRARTDLLADIFDVLSDMVLNPILRQEDINRERGVILEELAMYEDTPTLRIGDLFEQLTFKGSTLGRDIIGFPKSIKTINKNDFESYRKLYYYAENIILTISGGVDEKKVLQLANKHFTNLKSGDTFKPEVAKISRNKSHVLLSSQKREQAHFILGFVGNQYGHEDRFAESILATILGGGMSSRLFTEIREKRGLAYSVRSNDEHFADTGYFETYAGVEIKKVDEAIKVVLDEHYKIANEVSSIKNKELSKAKEYLKGHIALFLENSRNVNNFFGEEELYLKKVMTPEEVFKSIDRVSSQDVVNVAKKLLVPEKLNLAIIGPYKDRVQFEKLLA